MRCASVRGAAVWCIAGGVVVAFDRPVAADELGIDSTIDFVSFVDCLDGPNAPVAAGCTTSNFRPDSHVDLADFSVVQRSYLLHPGEIQVAAETAGEIDPIDDVDEYTFHGVFGSTVTVDFATPMVNNRPDLIVRLDLIRPNGTTASTTPSCGANARVDTIPIDATGTWKVRVGAYESWQNCGFGADEALRTGVYTLSVCPSDATAIPIAYGQSRTNVFSSDCQIVNYSFSGLLGDAASVMYLGPASTRRVRLYAPNGALLATSGGGQGAVINDVLLPLDGSYRIAVEAADGLSSRTFSLGLSRLNDAVEIPYNTVMPGVIRVAAEADSYTFEPRFGATVTVDFSTPSVGGRPDLAVRLDLIRPNGTTATTTASCGTNARLDGILIDMKGPWTVRVRAYESWFNCGFGADTNLVVGAYSLVVCPSNSVPAPIAYGQTRNGSFTVDCQIVNYAFDGETNDLASIMYLGPAYTRRVRLYAPNGDLLATSGAGQGVSLNDVLLPLDGQYLIAVEAADNQTIGNFSIGLSKLASSVPIAQATATPGALTLIAETEAYSFDGVFGNTVTVDFSTPSVSSRPDIVVRLDLIRPNGTTASSTASCGVNARLDTVPLDATGNWTVRVRSYEGWFNCGFGADANLLTGDYVLARCTSDSPAAPIAYGQTRGGAFAVDCQIVNYEFAGTRDDLAGILYFGSAYARRVRLFAPNGAFLASSGAGQGTTLDDLLLPVTGTYRIAVEAADNQALGDFTIGLSRLGLATPIVVDTTTPGTLSEIAESDAYSFSGTFGTTATVDYSTPILGNQPDIVARIDLVRPNGTTASSVPTCGGNARLDNVFLDATGDWTVRVRAYEGWFNCGFGPNTALLTGAYALAISRSDSPASAIGYAQTRNGNLVVDSQIMNFEFAGLLGDVPTAVYYGPAYVRRLQVFAPNGTLLIGSGGGLGTAILDLPLPVDGLYRLAVEAADNQATGDFSLGLSELGDAAAIPLNVATPGAVNQPAEVRLYSFERTNGDIVSVDYVTVVSSGKPDLPVRLDLVRPDGTTASSTASCGGTAKLNNVNVNQTGTWTVRVRAYESWNNCGFGPDAGLLTGAFSVKVCIGACP